MNKRTEVSWKLSEFQMIFIKQSFSTSLLFAFRGIVCIWKDTMEFGVYNFNFNSIFSLQVKIKRLATILILLSESASEYRGTVSLINPLYGSRTLAYIACKMDYMCMLLTYCVYACSRELCHCQARLRIKIAKPNKSRVLLLTQLNCVNWNFARDICGLDAMVVV